MEPKLTLDCACIAQMSYTLYQSETPLIRSLCIRNLTDAPLSEVTVRLLAFPAFAEEFSLSLGELPAGELIEIAPVNVNLLPEFLRTITERMHGQVTAEVTAGGETVFSDAIDLDLLPYDPDAASRPVTRQELWERKLLDLSLRNSLLNFRPGSSSVQLSANSLAALEDEVAKGEDMKLCPLPEGLHGVQDDFRICRLQENGADVAAAMEKCFRAHQIAAFMTETELQKVLKKLHRQAKVSLEENGANTLYLALGFLKWFETERSARPRYAPLILVPVDLVRRITGQSYSLRVRDEETQVNITLLELLRQDFGIRIQGLEPVPEDDSGVDIPLIFDTFRAGVANKEGWEIEELAFLGQFSFSQFIMWNDIRRRSEELRQNKIVASLISGALEWEPVLYDLTPAELDEQIPPSALAVPTSADSSQMAAIYAAAQGESFVLHGPPGTGKSQTITNMIANALYNGKTVLFVAEKMAALSVVQKRLEKLGLDPFCLELHSNKAQKRAVLNQLESALNVGRVKSPAAYASAAEDLHRRRLELDAVIRALHAVQPIGMSLYDAVTEYDRYAQFKERLHFPQTFARTTTAADHAANLERIGRVRAADGELGGYAGSPLQNYRNAEYSLEIRDAFRSAAQRFADALAPAQESWNALALGDAGSLAHYYSVLDILQTAAEGNYLPAALTEEDVLSARAGEISALLANGRACRMLAEEITAQFDHTIFSVNGEQAKLQWKQNEQKWAIPRMMGRSRLVKNLAAHARQPVSVTAENYLAICEKLIQLQTLRSQLAGTDPALTAPFGAMWQQERSDFAQIEALCEGTRTLRQKLASVHDPALLMRLRTPAGEALAPALAARDTLYGAMQILRDTCKVDFSPLEAANAFFAAAQREASGWLANISHLRERSVLEGLLQSLNAHGLGSISEAYRAGTLSADEMENAYRCEAARVTIHAALEQHAGLNALTGTQLEIHIGEYRKAADEFAALTVQELLARLSARIPAPGEGIRGNSEISILQRAIRSGGRAVSIRKLFESIPTLLHRMCPCMLMSPISVAQYIDPSFPKFDLVIFDEASQLPTSEAVGAIARGENAVIVGDPKQLPPTAFFTSQHFDADNADKEDLESVLDDCLALSMPSRHLLWHYRSRHESLIAFSNTNFYDGKLLTFPSPDDLVSRVTRVQVEGFYDKSKTRQNRAEAEAVVSEIMRRLSDETLCRDSLGVVTFSVVQQNLIDDLLTEAFVKYPELETRAEAMHEPIFIKNLENVQGDERDVILFSIGYGPDENGQVSMNFGPINQDGGWRRLNVAVSRARKEMKVFSVIRPEQIDLSKSSAEGVAKLRAFLEFADRGTTLRQAQQDNFQPDAFAQEIADALTGRGYTVKCGIGCSGFRIDAAVVHPDDPERYLLAILCGSRREQEVTARDRHISQPSVLRGLGWQIVQVYLLDWLDDPERVLNRLEEAVQTALAAEKLPDEEENPQPSVFSAESFEHEETAAAVPVTPYVSAELPEMGSPEAFQLPMAQAKIAEAIRQVIAAEAPVSRKILQKRVFAAWGISRTNQRIETAFRRALETVMPAVTESGGAEFFWRDDQIPSVYEGVRAGSGANKRPVEEICREELCSGVLLVLRGQVSLPRADLIRTAAKQFGFQRTTPAVETAFNDAIALAAERGAAKIEGEQVVLTDAI